MAPDTAIGASSPIDAGGGNIPSTANEKLVAYLSAQARSLAERRGSAAVTIADDAIVKARAVTANEAHDAKLVDFIAGDVNDLIRQLDGFQVEVKGQARTLHTAGAQVTSVEMTGVESALIEVADVLTDPNIVFMLLAVGVILIILELNTPGSWVFGTGGVISLGLALYGLGILPVNWLGLVFIGLAFGLFLLDIKAPTHGALSAAATASLIAGAIILFGTPEVRPFGVLSLPLVIGFSLFLAAIFLSLVIMAVRAQKRRPVTGLEGMVGRTGQVVRDIDPLGMVRVWGENWQAESVDAQPIVTGAMIEVVEVTGRRMRVRLHS
jgi:membrane-bound serine protease (ClpP class)